MTNEFEPTEKELLQDLINLQIRSNEKQESIKNYLKFFFWYAIIALGLGILISLNLLR